MIISFVWNNKRFQGEILLHILQNQTVAKHPPSPQRAGINNELRHIITLITVKFLQYTAPSKNATYCSFLTFTAK
jgi:hypothetical protein